MPVGSIKQWKLLQPPPINQPYSCTINKGAMSLCAASSTFKCHTGALMGRANPLGLQTNKLQAQKELIQCSVVLFDCV